MAAPLLIAEPVQNITLDEQTVCTVPVSMMRVTTVQFPSAISAIDAALITSDNKSPGFFQMAHTKGTSYFSVRALGKGVSTNVNVRWNGKTVPLELRESETPCYVLNLLRPASHQPAKPLTSARLLGLLDKAKEYPYLHHSQMIADVDYRDCTKEACITDCNEYEVQLHEAFRFNAEDTIVLRIRVRNKSAKPIEFERWSVRAGEQVFYPSVTQMADSVAPNASIDGYLAITGRADGSRNDLSLKNDFTITAERKLKEEAK
jgi:hypothetical protein